MKRLVIALLMVALVCGTAGARKKKDKAGEIIDGVYIDKMYNFSLAVSKDVWDISIKKNTSQTRMNLTKKVFDIPIEYAQDPGYTKTPKVTVYVDTTSWSVKMFVDSLLNDNFKSDQKRDILHLCEILFGDFKPKRNSRYQFGDIQGILITGELRYTKQIPSATSNTSPDIITDFYGGAVFFAKQDKNLYIFHMICENKYFSTEFEDYVKLLNGLKFTGEKADKDK